MRDIKRLLGTMALNYLSVRLESVCGQCCASWKLGDRCHGAANGRR